MSKKDIFLVLTPVRETYPENFTGKIIFLGSKDFSFLQKKNPKAEIEKINTVWSDKSQLNKDLIYLSNFETIFFRKIYQTLNKFYNSDKNEKYWSIYIRPTVFSILAFFYERWLRILEVNKRFNIKHCKYVDFELDDLISYDNENLYKKMYFDDLFNQIIFQKILDSQNSNFNKIQAKKLLKDNSETKSRKDLYQYFKKLKINNFIFLFNKYFETCKNFLLLHQVKNKKFTYISKYLKNKEIRKTLNTYFKQPNFIFSINNLKKKNKNNSKLRDEMSNVFESLRNSKFEEFSSKNIFKILPKCFVENFQMIQKQNICFEKKFKFDFGIILYDQLYNNDFCELDWIAKNYMNGSKLLLAQNGGGWVTAENSTIKSVMEKFNFKQIVFGIEDDLKKNIYGAGIYRFKKEKKIIKDNGKIIYALYTPYGYSGQVRSNAPISDEWVEYFEMHEKFIDSLSPNIQKELILRPKRRQIDYHNIRERLKNKFPNIQIDDFSVSLKERLSNSRLLITTLDTTTVLEGLAINFPTILICDFDKYKISSEYLNYYKELIEAKILFINPLDANRHIEKVFFDTKKWWNEKKLQDIRERFCKKFAYHPNNQNLHLIEKISKIVE